MYEQRGTAARMTVFSFINHVNGRVFAFRIGLDKNRQRGESVMGIL